MDNNTELQGIGGWLILPVIGIVFTPVRLGYIIYTTFIPIFLNNTWEILTTPGTAAYHNLWAPLLIFEITGNICLIILPIILLILIFKRHHKVPGLFIIFYGAGLAFLIVDLYLSSLIPFVAAQNNSESWKEVMRSLIVAAIWIPYFLNSKRVRNTFINGKR